MTVATVLVSVPALDTNFIVSPTAISLVNAAPEAMQLFVGADVAAVTVPVS